MTLHENSKRDIPAPVQVQDTQSDNQDEEIYEDHALIANDREDGIE